MTLPMDRPMPSPLLTIANRYKTLANKPSSFIAEALHFKNPDDSLQIKLLEEADKHIYKVSMPEEIPLQQLGILLIFRNLLADPNRENEVYYSFIEGLGVDEQINAVLKKISPGMTLDFTNFKFLELSKIAMDIGKSIIHSFSSERQFPKDFIEDIDQIVFAEKDNTDRLLQTLKVSRRP